MNCLVLGLALSLHVGLQNDYNQVHPYVMCEKNQVITGLYYNSLDKASVVLAKEYDLTDDLKLDVGIVSGYVYDGKTKEPLPFCNIICKSTNIGTTSNIDGKFEINAIPNSELQISFIGYKTKTIIAKSKKVRKIYLNPGSALIAEVRVVVKEDPAVILMKEVIKKKRILKTK